MDAYYARKKEHGLIYIEAYLKQGGSANSIKGGQVNCAPFLRETGVPQWSREKKRYLTFKEWVVHQRYWERRAVALGITKSGKWGDD